MRVTGGAFLLATFWANVLQHQLNYPPSKFAYCRQTTNVHHTGRPHELLQLTVDDEGVKVFVDMTSGVLTVSGKLAYDWFPAKFRRLLENVDARFARDWVFVATPTGDLPLPSDDRTWHCDETTDG